MLEEAYGKTKTNSMSRAFAALKQAKEAINQVTKTLDVEADAETIKLLKPVQNAIAFALNKKVRDRESRDYLDYWDKREAEGTGF